MRKKRYTRVKAKAAKLAESMPSGITTTEIAINSAPDTDRKWRLEHPEEVVYKRNYIPGEFGPDYPLREGAEIMVLFPEPGVRVKTFLDNEGITIVAAEADLGEEKKAAKYVRWAREFGPQFLSAYTQHYSPNGMGWTPPGDPAPVQTTKSGLILPGNN